MRRACAGGHIRARLWFVVVAPQQRSLHTTSLTHKTHNYTPLFVLRGDTGQQRSTAEPVPMCSRAAKSTCRASKAFMQQKPQYLFEFFFRLPCTNISSTPALAKTTPVTPPAVNKLRKPGANHIGVVNLICSTQLPFCYLTFLTLTKSRSGAFEFA